jgi:hypothetical protein
MMQRFILLFLFSFGFLKVEAQVPEQVLDSVSEKLIIISGDSVFKSSIDLQEVFVYGKLKFTSYDDKLRYYILRRKTHKVYPYAKLAAERLVELNDSLKGIKKSRKRKKHTRKVQKYIEGEFSEELKKLTRTEGQILVKLIYRQTGTTSFGLVKELRNGWRAFWYNTTANMFKISIKEEFHPDIIEEDYLIEDILQRAFSAGKLERQESVLDYNYADLSNKWKKHSKDVKKN